MRLLRWLLVGLVLSPALGSAQNRGVPQSGFPSWQERMIYVYTNRARADPLTELATCTVCAERACYNTPMAPVTWSYNLNRAARFHAGNLEDTNCFQHESPCTLVAGIQNVYIPVGSCLGQASCACSNVKQCGAAAGYGTATFTRIAAFGTSGSGENIAYSSNGTPRYIFDLWIREPDSNPACGYRSANGHRYSILNPSNRALGAGYYRVSRDMYVQDFGGTGTPTGTLITGGHDPQFTTSGTTTVNFRVNYYNTGGAPQSGKVNVDGVCTAMTQERGVAATNATWLSAQPLAGNTCRRYVFEFKDPAGVTVRLPETGSYGVGASVATCADWSSAALAACPSGGNQPPTVAAAAAATPNPVLASTTSLSALGADDGGEAALVYTWSATGPAAVAFSANGTNAARASTATFTAAGSYPVTVTIRDAQGLTVTSTVTVAVNRTLTTVIVSPATASVGPGATQQFTASGRDQFGATLTAQPSFTWTTSGGGTVSGSGLFTAGSTAGGPFTLTAASGGKSGTASITVTAGSAPTVVTAAAATPNPVPTTTTSLSALGADDGGEAALVYTWSATGPAAVGFSANGTNAAKASTATFTTAGSYALTVTIRDAQSLTATSVVSVTVGQTLTTVVVSPASASVAAAGTQQFTASARDQFGATLTAQPAFAWSVSGGGTVSSSGLFTAGASPGGPFTLTAASGGRSGSASVTVSAGSAPTVATAAAAAPNPVLASTTALNVLGADDGGEAALTYSWAATGPAAVSFTPNATNAARASTAGFIRAGSYLLTVTIRDAGGQSVTSTVTVTVAQSLTSVAIAPGSAAVVVNATAQFAVTGSDQFGDPLVTQPAFTWTVSGGGTINGSGLFTAGGAPGGPFTVTGSSGGRSGTATLTVTAGNPPTVATAAAAAPNPVLGSTAALTVLGADDGGEGGLTYTWSASGPAAVSWSVNGTHAASSATATFTRAGTYVVTVTITDAGGQATTSVVTVTVQQVLTAISVMPASTAVATGSLLGFLASAADQFGNALSAQPVFGWTVSGGGTIDAAGQFTAGTVTGGPHTVTATSGGKSGTAVVTVVAGAAPTIATAASASPNPVLATTTSLSALGADDGGEAALSYTWSATGPAPVTFSANGTNAARSAVAVFTAAGSYAFTVTVRDAQNLTALSSVTVVVQPAPTAVVVSPSIASVLVGATAQFSATVGDQFGAALTPQPALAWTVSGGGTLSTGGLFTAATAGGPFTVTASSGGRSGTAQVTVTTAPDLTPPVVALTAPLEGAIVSGIVSLEATATDDQAVALVEFFVDGASIGTGGGAPWTTSWDASFAAPGAHRLRARATDSSGNAADSAEVTVTIAGDTADVTAPLVAITAPANGATVEGRLVVSAEASDEVGVASVRFFLDGVEVGAAAQAPWTVTLESKGITLGTHALTASAFDAAGNRGEAAPVSFERIRPAGVTGVLSCGCQAGASSAAPWLLLGLAALARRRVRRH